MSDKKLNVERREKTGKGFARAVRRGGKIPAIFYFHGEEAVPLIIDEKTLLGMLATKASLITLQMDDGSEREAIIREIQRHPVSGNIEHIDFLGIKRGVKITATVPLHFTGEAPGVKAGGIVEHLLREIEIECLPKDLPESLDVDLSNMEIGDSRHISDLDYENIRILTREDTGIVNVIMPKVAVVAVVEEELEEVEEAEEVEAAEEEAEAAEEKPETE